MIAILVGIDWNLCDAQCAHSQSLFQFPFGTKTLKLCTFICFDQEILAKHVLAGRRQTDSVLHCDYSYCE